MCTPDVVKVHRLCAKIGRARERSHGRKLFKSFNELLAREVGADKWRDNLILVAQHAKANLVEADWLVLRGAWWQA
jgi:hypothetical protein